MKFSAAFGLALAPLSMARQVRNVYPPTNPSTNVETELSERGVTVVKGMRGEGITVDSRTEVVIIWANPGGGAATTTINQQVTVTKTVTAGGQETAIPQKGATHTVKVGGPGGLTYQPDQLNNIPVGDTVVFEFLSQNHTVTQSPFDTPCKRLAGGMDSGFLANPNNTVSPPPQVAMQVMATTPLWFYCRQKGHCGKGMVFSINPTAAKTQAMFQSMAIAQNGTGQSTPITGGSAPGNQAPAAPPSSSSVGAAQPSAGAGSGSGGNVAPGQGTVGADGSCTCVASCGAGSFPAQNQGIGSFGGMGGSLPINMGAMR